MESKVALQCKICGRLDNTMVYIQLPIEECAILYKKHIAEIHPMANLKDMILEKHI